MDEWEIVPGRVLALVQGDITIRPADAIVNAANSSLAGGGGVDGAIHRAGGETIMADLERRYGPPGVRECLAGGAVVSEAGWLPARWVIHAVGPRWRGGGHGEAEQLASAYRTSLMLADGLEARQVTLPAISTGIYGYPLEAAAAVAVGAVADGLRSATSVERATFVLFSAQSLAAFESALVRSRTGGR